MTVETDSLAHPEIYILPYSRIVGQRKIKLALEIAYVAPQRLGGILISGQRGTGKSIRDKLRRKCSCQAGLRGWLKKE